MFAKYVTELHQILCVGIRSYVYEPQKPDHQSTNQYKAKYTVLTSIVGAELQALDTAVQIYPKS
jgi:hypothetical protein